MSTPTDFDKALMDILHLAKGVNIEQSSVGNAFRADGISYLSDLTHDLQAIKQAVDKYVIGEDRYTETSLLKSEKELGNDLAQTLLQTEQRQSLWVTK